MSEAQLEPVVKASSAGVARPAGGARLVEESRFGIFLVLARREFSDVWRDRRTPVLGLFLVLSMTTTSWLGARQAQLEEQGVAAVDTAYREQLSRSTVADAAGLLHPAIKPSWQLAFALDEGVADEANVAWLALSAWLRPSLEQLPARVEEPPQPAGISLDWMYVFQTVGVLVAFLLSYESLCDPKQRGRLRLLRSYPLSIWSLLGGRFLALWSVLGSGLSVGAMLGLGLALVVGWWPQPADLWRLAILMFLGFWLMALATWAALLVSALSREGSHSLAVLALIWLVAVQGIPATATLIALRQAPVMVETELSNALAGIRQQVETQEDPGGWRGREVGRFDDYKLERAAAAVHNRRAASQRQLRLRVYEQRLQQAELAAQLAAVAPTALVRMVGERLTGAGVERQRCFLRAVQDYRRALARWMRVQDQRDPDSPHLLFFPQYLSQRPVDLESRPVFRMPPVSAWSSLRSAVPGLLLLVLETLVVVAATLICFARQEELR